MKFKNPFKIIDRIRADAKSHKFKDMGSFGCSRLMVDENNGLWQYFDKNFMKELYEPKAHSLGSYPCQSLCRYTLHRPHLTCQFCRARRVAIGKMANLFPVNPYVLHIRVDRRHALIKDFILKRWLTVAELLAS